MLVTVNVFNLFSIYNTEQIYFILFINDPYDYPFFLIKIKNSKRIAGVYTFLLNVTCIQYHTVFIFTVLFKGAYAVNF